MCGLLPIPDGRLAALATTGQVPQQAVIQRVEELEDHSGLVMPVPASRVLQCFNPLLGRCAARRPVQPAKPALGGVQARGH